MASESTNNEEPGFLGYLSLGVFLVVIAWGMYGVYSRFFRIPAPAISLSAYFVDGTGGTQYGPSLKIRGQAYLIGQPLKDGSVRLTVSRQEPAFEQSVLTDLKNGGFEIEDPSFRSLRPADQIHITAEVSSSQFRATATDELYLNTGPQSLSLGGEIALWGTIVAVIGVFLFAFTGKKTPWKNRTAIILSYCIIGISLTVPLLAPVLLLRAFPRLRCSMNDAPAGIVVTAIGEGLDSHTQWALNIGGYSTKKLADLSAASGHSSNASIGKAGATALQEPIDVANAAPAADQVSQDSPRRTNPTPDAHPTEKQANPGTVSTGDTDTLKGSENLRASKEIDCSGVVKVDGGLVIPLYVIILSIIGGAINMTRKVPRYQREGEHSEVSLPPVGRLFSFRRWKKRAPNHRPLSLKTENPKEAEGVTKVKGALSQDKTATAGAPTQNVATDTVGAGTEGKAEDGAKEKSALSQDKTATAGAPTQNVATDTAGAGTEERADGGGADAAEQLPIPDRAKEIDSQLDELVREQVRLNADTDSAMSRIRALVQQMRDLFDSKKDDDRILGCESFEDWLGNRVNLKELLGSNWRVELLNQYMYLVSAPFLAMVAYYLLQLLGVASKQPIVVLISFSVGLISERIVSSILGVATGYLRGGASTQPVSQQG